MNSRRLLFKHFNYPLYIPIPNRSILAVLAEQGVSGMTAELERLSSLGSAWASATLGYLSILPSASGSRDPQQAVELCSKAASDGDPYALFITAWARFLLTKDRVKAGETMLQASRMSFTPATLAMAFFLWPDTKAALRFVDAAARLGHKDAWSWRCAFSMTGRLGNIQRITGYVLMPFARLRYVVGVWRNPLSENVLVVTLTNQRPIYR
jgi:hypothetical protein